MVDLWHLGNISRNNISSYPNGIRCFNKTCRSFLWVNRGYAQLKRLQAQGSLGPHARQRSIEVIVDRKESSKQQVFLVRFGKGTAVLERQEYEGIVDPRIDVS